MRSPFRRVGEVSLLSESSTSAAAAKIMAAYPYRKLTRGYGSARAGDTVGVDRALAEAIVRMARALGAHPNDLANVMNHESGFTFRPDVQSGQKIGDPFDAGKATGIIQFLPSTARSLGTTTAALARMTATEQVPYIQRYFERVRSGEHSDSWGKNPIPGPRNGKLDTLQKVAMAVFFPRAMDWSPHKLFPSAVAVQHPTPASYVRAVARRAKLPSTQIPGLSPVELAARLVPSRPATIAVGLAAGLLVLGVAIVATSGRAE